MNFYYFYFSFWNQMSDYLFENMYSMVDKNFRNVYNRALKTVKDGCISVMSADLFSAVSIRTGVQDDVLNFWLLAISWPLLRNLRRQWSAHMKSVQIRVSVCRVIILWTVLLRRAK